MTALLQAALLPTITLRRTARGAESTQPTWERRSGSTRLGTATRSSRGVCALLHF